MKRFASLLVPISFVATCMLGCNSVFGISEGHLADAGATNACDFVTQTGCPSGDVCEANDEGVTVCNAGGAAALGDSCLTDKCAPGGVCVGSVCRPPCASPGDSCGDGYHACAPVIGSTGADIPGVAVCYRDCDPLKQTGCLADQTCYSGNEQIPSACIPAGPLGLGADCTNGICQKGLWCLGDDKQSFCYARCSPGADPTCPNATDTCTPITHGTNQTPTTYRGAAVGACVPQ